MKKGPDIGYLTSNSCPGMWYIPSYSLAGVGPLFFAGFF